MIHLIFILNMLFSSNLNALKEIPDCPPGFDQVNTMVAVGPCAVHVCAGTNASTGANGVMLGIDCGGTPTTVTFVWYLTSTGGLVIEGIGLDEKEAFDLVGGEVMAELLRIYGY